MTDAGAFSVRVIDRAPMEAGSGWPRRHGREFGAARPLTDEALTAGVGFALLAGFVEDLRSRPVADGVGTEVRMSWPVSRRAWPTERLWIATSQCGLAIYQIFRITRLEYRPVRV